MKLYGWMLDDVLEIFKTRYAQLHPYNFKEHRQQDAARDLMGAYQRWYERMQRQGTSDGTALVEAFTKFNDVTWKLVPPADAEAVAEQQIQNEFKKEAQNGETESSGADGAVRCADEAPQALVGPGDGGVSAATAPADGGGAGVGRAGADREDGAQHQSQAVVQAAGSEAPAAAASAGSPVAEGEEAPQRRLSLRVFPENRDFNSLPSFDHKMANCGECPLASERAESQCLSQQPEAFNGLVIMGEGPGVDEAMKGVPFVGKSGVQLDRMLALAGISREQTYVMNATLCKPPPMRGLSAKEAKKKKNDIVSSAVQHCRPRVLAELEAVNPRVVFALGAFALDSLTGTVSKKNKHHDIHCHENGHPESAPPGCMGVRKWKAWGCSKCKKIFDHLRVPETAAGVKPEPPSYSTCEYGCGLEEGKTPPKKPPRWVARNQTCGGCDGKKKRVEPYELFKSEWSIGGQKGVAGGVFYAKDLQIASSLAEDAIVVPSYHPAHMIRPAKKEGEKAIGGQFLLSAFHDHLLKVKRFLTQDPLFDFSWREIRDPNEFLAWAYAPGTEGVLFEVDIETDAKEPYDVRDITCIGFGIVGQPGDRVVLPTSNMPIHHPLVQAAVRFLGDPSRRKLLQNGFSYDCIVVPLRWGVSIAGYTDDNQIAHTVLRPDEPHHLQHQAGVYTDATPWKPPKTHKGQQVFESAKQLHEYNAKDVRVTGLAFEGLTAELQRTPARVIDGNTKAFRDLGHSMESVYRMDMLKAQMALSMSDVGVPIDRKVQLQIGAELRLEYETLRNEMTQMVGRLPPHVFNSDDPNARFNPASQPQLQWVLFDPQGPCRLAPTIITESGGHSTSAEALLPYVSHPFVSRLLAYRTAFRDYGSNIEGLDVADDFRVHPRWYPQGARTGRWSSSPNIQNWKKWLRSMVKAPPGRIFIGADYSQLELRILAALCGDPEMIRRCRDADESRKLEPEFDPHSYVAAMSLGEAFTSLSLKDPQHDKNNRKCRCETCTRKHYRDVTKRTVYGLNYGSGEETILASIYDGGYDGPPIELSMIAAAKKGYFSGFPRVEPFREGTLDTALRYGYITDAVLGRYRVFPRNDIEAPIAYNFPIQSTGASIVDIAMWKLYNELPKVDPTAFIWAQVHDAIYVECDVNKAREVAQVQEACMSCAVTLVPGAEPMPLPAAAAIAYDWKSAG